MLDRTAYDRSHREEQDQPASLLEEGRNVWRVARAERAKVLVDGANYFGALRAAMLEARETIYIVGWDLDSRMKLVGPSGTAEDGLPEGLADFLSALVKRRPGLKVRLLLWDYSMVFSLERELAPVLSFLWRTPPQIEICLDDVLPIGASHHQKIVVIDDALAFSGGLDLTSRRWDTPDHRPDDPLRVDHSGTPYDPFHDVQMVVNGEAAAALSELVHMRWERAACEPARRRRRPAPLPDELPWPAGLEPDFHNVDIGIARTIARCGDQAPVAEVETLFIDMVGHAERLVYVENQFVTHAATARALAARMIERPELEALIVTPRSYPGWLERKAMLSGRLRFMRILKEAGCGERVRLVYPECRDGTCCAAAMVHSKVMIVDDTILRVGSANLCNRSMGLDTECDLVAEAHDDDTRAAIARIRDALIAEHSGIEPARIAAALEAGEPVLPLVDAGSDSARCLRPVEDETSGLAEDEHLFEAMADPTQPLEMEPIEEDRSALPAQPGRARLMLIVKLALVVAGIGLLTLIWQNSPLGNPERIVQSIASIADRPWAPAAVIATFVVAECVAFPVTLLIFGTVVVFGGWTGALLAGLGAMASAVITFMVGRHLGARVLRRFIGPRINRVRRGLADRGVMAVAAVRVVPVAPFTVVNLVAGAVGLRFFDYAVGTAMGLAPGILVMSALGNQIAALFRDPSALGIAALVGGLLAWVALGIGLQFLVARYRSSRG